MAISPMQHLSLILPTNLMDELLLSLQSEESVQIYDLSAQEDWQVAFQTSDGTKGLAQRLDELRRREEQLEKAIQALEPFIPQKKGLEKLKEAPLSLSFQELESHGLIRDEQRLLQSVHKQLAVLAKARDRIQLAQEEVSSLEKWVDLTTTPDQLKRFRYVRGLIGTIPNSEQDQARQALLAHPDVEVDVVFSSETEHGVVVLYKSGDLTDLQDTLTSSHFKEFDYQGESLPKERLEQLKREIKEQGAVEAATLETLSQAKEEAKGSLASTAHLVALEGWIETAQLEALKAKLQKEFGDQVVFQTREVTQDEWDQVPIKLKNNALVEPFELVTEMYALPKYYEKDPTPIVSLFYFVFFGMMVADIGYGLLLTLATGFALKAFQLQPSAAKNLRFFCLLGISVALWGVVYGSFFGFEMPFALISTTTNAMTILILSVVFGFITVLVGLFLGGMKNVRLKDYTEAYNAGFAWVLILLGLMLLAVGNILPGLSYLVPIGQWLAILNAIGILVVSIVSAKKLSGLAAGLFNLYNVSGYVGDLVSFTRLMALGLSGASIGSAFNLIVNLFPTLGRFTVGLVLFVLLHAINMFLSFLSGYVHGARLIFVEFFGKFYEGGGKPFQPLKPSERYVKTKK